MREVAFFLDGFLARGMRHVALLVEKGGLLSDVLCALFDVYFMFHNFIGVSSLTGS